MSKAAPLSRCQADDCAVSAAQAGRFQVCPAGVQNCSNEGDQEQATFLDTQNRVSPVPIQRHDPEVELS